MEEKIEVPRERSNSLTKLLSRRHKITEQNDPVEETKPVMKVINSYMVNLFIVGYMISPVFIWSELWSNCEIS